MADTSAATFLHSTAYSHVLQLFMCTSGVHVSCINFWSYNFHKWQYCSWTRYTVMYIYVPTTSFYFQILLPPIMGLKYPRYNTKQHTINQSPKYIIPLLNPPKSGGRLYDIKVLSVYAFLWVIFTQNLKLKHDCVICTMPNRLMPYSKLKYLINTYHLIKNAQPVQLQLLFYVTK